MIQLLDFSFPLRLEPCGPWQLNVIAISARHVSPLYNWPLIPQPINWNATARLAVDTTFTMETSISRNLWGTWQDNLCVFFGAPAFFLACTSSAINSVPPNEPIYLVSDRVELPTRRLLCLLSYVADVST